MDIVSSTKLIFAFIFVISLIALLAFGIRKLETIKNKIAGKSTSRLKISDTLYIDNSRRLIIIKRDNTEHLILIGKTGETHIEGPFKNDT